MEDEDEDREGGELGCSIYFLPTDIDILVAYICETDVYEERRGGEEVGMDVGYGSCQGVFLRGGEWGIVFDFVERHYFFFFFFF